MNIEDFNQTLFLAAKLVERGDFADAGVAMRPWLDTPLDDKGKAIICVNLAVVADHLGDEQTAASWYDHGASYERVMCTEHKGAWLAQKGRSAEAQAVYEGLLAELLSAEERQRIEHNVALLKTR